MSLLDTIRADLAVIAADMGNPTFAWNGEEYSCVVGSGAETLVLGDGGFEVSADLLLVVNRALFTDNILPHEQQKLTYKSKSYRIAKVTLDPVGAVVRLACVATARGI